MPSVKFLLLFVFTNLWLFVLMTILTETEIKGKANILKLTTEKKLWEIFLYTHLSWGQLSKAKYLVFAEVGRRGW